MTKGDEALSPTQPSGGGYFELSAEPVPPDQRLEFWYELTGRRMRCTPARDPNREVKAHLRGLVRGDVEFLDYVSESFFMTRDRAMCRRDGREEVSIGLVVGPRTGAVQEEKELVLGKGDLYIIDFGKPVSSTIPGHHELAVALPRQMVVDAIGNLDRLGGSRLPVSGIGSLLSSHMRALANEARYLTPAQQQVAMQAAADLALCALQSASPDRRLDEEQYALGLYTAACQIIRQHCADYEFNADKLAAIMGCSRATLYRLFSGRDRNVAAEIWEARIANAYRMLKSPRFAKLTIGEIALRSGFLDQSTFSKMFKQRYGISPRDIR